MDIEKVRNKNINSSQSTTQQKPAVSKKTVYSVFNPDNKVVNNVEHSAPEAKSFKAPLASNSDFRSKISNFFSNAASVGTNLANGAKKMFTSFKENAKWLGNKLNHRINYLNQYYEGNCAFLAAVQALGERKDSEQILKNSIHQTKDGFKVIFPGAKSGGVGSKEKPIYISKSQALRDATKQRNGGRSDLEAAILNQAVKKVLGPPPYYPSKTLALLTGKKVKDLTHANPNSINKFGKKGVVGCWDNHAWCIEGYKNGVYYLRNPHDTSHVETRRDRPWGVYATSA